MTTSQSGYKDFRRRLDDVLRARDAAALRQFLINEGQWTEETATDPEAAMWMMIATSPALASMHTEAERWLMTHGHESEAQAIFGGRRGGGGPKPGGTGARPAGSPGRRGGRPGGPPARHGPAKGGRPGGGNRGPGRGGRQP